MKKICLLSIVAVIGMITAIAIIQFNENNSGGILNANVEALAAAPGGGDVVKCAPDGPTCYHDIILCDEKGNPLKDPEGNPIKYTERIDGKKNVKPEAE